MVLLTLSQLVIAQQLCCRTDGSSLFTTACVYGGPSNMLDDCGANAGITGRSRNWSFTTLMDYQQMEEN